MAESAARFVELWTRAQPEVRRYIGMLVHRAADADDILQETALRLLSKFHEYEADRPFLPWAARFAYHEVLAWRQRQARSRVVFSESLLEQLDRAFTQEAPLLELRRRLLDGCLAQLTDRERNLILRRYAEHGSVRQEAAETGTSVHKLYYGIEKLRLRLLECIGAKMQREGWDHG